MKSLLRSKTGLVTAVLGLLVAGVAPAACSSSDGGGTAGGGGVAANGGGGSGGGAAHDGGGGSSASGGSGGSLILDSGTGGGGGLADGATCDLVTQKADLVPLDLYIMLDKSGSMNEPTGTTTKWEAIKAAIEAFVQDPASKDLGVGVQFFPGSPECNTTTYSTPAVPIAALPGNGAAIATALDGTVPGGQTPTKPALQGAVDYINEWLLQNPTHAGVIVLATDGAPNDCASTVDSVSTVASAAAADSPKVLTFVIGVGSALTSLDQIAAAGGSTKAYIVDTGGNVTQQFVDALNAIRGGAIACEYLIPTPEGGTIDPGKVNVQYTPGDGSPPLTIPNVKDQASCPANGNGWYYDNPASPTKVILCPHTCDTAKADSKAQVGVAFGCKTIIA